MTFLFDIKQKYAEETIISETTNNVIIYISLKYHSYWHNIWFDVIIAYQLDNKLISIQKVRINITLETSKL